jgi:pimeloyl-ACP methyl ester carboxylesterase
MTDFAQHRIALPTGVELDVWTAGDPANPPIIFLHGFPDSHRTWRHQMAGLADQYFCIAPDQRGYARSSKPAELAEYRVPKLVGDVLALADHFGCARFTLAAHDWGGAIGWAIAIKHGHRVERLVICNAAHPYVYQRTLIEDLPQRAATQYIRVFRDDSLDREIAEKGVEWFFTQRFDAHLGSGAMTQGDRAAYLDEWSQPGAITAMLNWYRASPMQVPAMESTERSPFLDQPFPRVFMPVLVIWGMDDVALLPCQLEGLDDHVADLTIVRIPGAGHFVPWERPGEVTAAMRDWLLG